jgi:hypothetical protein
MGRYVYEDGRPGRPKVPVKPEPPEDISRLISRLNGQMPRLGIRGWYRELAKRQRREYLSANPSPFKSGRRISGPFEMDRFMCRTDIVAECKNETDLEVARFNGRIVLEIETACPNGLIFKKIRALLDRARKRPSRRINTKHWTEHRVLVLYDLKLMGYDLSQDRKQLATWLFPNIRSEKFRGDKFDRAKQYLREAISLLPALRAQSSR